MVRRHATTWCPARCSLRDQPSGLLQRSPCWPSSIDDYSNPAGTWLHDLFSVSDRSTTQPRHFVNYTGCRSFIVCSTNCLQGLLMHAIANKEAPQSTYRNLYSMSMKQSAAPTYAPPIVSPSSNHVGLLQPSSLNERFEVAFEVWTQLTMTKSCIIFKHYT